MPAGRLTVRSPQQSRDSRKYAMLSTDPHAPGARSNQEIVESCVLDEKGVLLLHPFQQQSRDSRKVLVGFLRGVVALDGVQQSRDSRKVLGWPAAVAAAPAVGSNQEIVESYALRRTRRLRRRSAAAIKR